MNKGLSEFLWQDTVLYCVQVSSQAQLSVAEKQKYKYVLAPETIRMKNSVCSIFEDGISGGRELYYTYSPSHCPALRTCAAIAIAAAYDPSNDLVCVRAAFTRRSAWRVRGGITRGVTCFCCAARCCGMRHAAARARGATLARGAGRTA